MSPRLPGFVRRSARLRQVAIQARKRLPIELSGALGVAPFVMAKSLGCFLTAESRFALAGVEGASHRAARLVEALRARGGYETGAWGYEFDVQTRWAFYRGGEPNVIATVFVGRGLLEHALVAGDASSLEAARNAAGFICESFLQRDGAPYFTYAPGSMSLVHNANLLASALVAAVGSVSGDPQMLELAAGAAATSMQRVSDVGVLPYGESAGLKWEDNFHTAYCADATNWLALAGVSGAAEARTRLVHRWTERFFSAEGAPFYFSDHSGACDIHSAATAVDVAARLADEMSDLAELADRVESWTRTHLVDPETGLTYYQKHRGWTDRRNFRRWGDAHWALARSSMQLLRQGIAPPVEAVLASRSGVR